MKLILFILFLTSLYGTQCCPFCDPEVIERQKVYENDLILVLYTHKPVTEGHCLIIPKRHVERFEELSEQEAIQLFHAVQKVDQAVEKTLGTRPYILLQKNGSQVGQSVPHVHVHYIPRKEDETSVAYFAIQLLTRDWFPTLTGAEQQKMIDQLKPAFCE